MAEGEGAEGNYLMGAYKLREKFADMDLTNAIQEARGWAVGLILVASNKATLPPLGGLDALTKSQRMCIKAYLDDTKKWSAINYLPWLGLAASLMRIRDVCVGQAKTFEEVLQESLAGVVTPENAQLLIGNYEAALDALDILGTGARIEIQ